MYLCSNCQRPINSASAACPYCGADQTTLDVETRQGAAQPRKHLKLAITFVIVIAGIWAIIWLALPLRFANPRPAAEHGAVEAVRSLQQQLANYESGAGSFPQSLESLGDPAQEAAQDAMAGGYSIHYTPEHLDADGKAHSYTLLALPRNYGYDSLYVDQGGVVRATRENRPATAQDPPVK